MELPNPEQIDVDGVSSALLADIDDAARKVNELRPLGASVVKGILDELLGERVYSSNAIEGNTLDLRETKEILRTGHLIVAKKREATEALNLGKAIEHAQQVLVPSTEPYSTDGLLALHRIILTGLQDEAAGRFRTRSVVISGAKHKPPEAKFVPGLVDRMIEKMNKCTDVHPVVLATWTHACLAAIHPFLDGNGRTARLWQDVVLLRNRLTCAIIQPPDRREYFEALEASDDGEFSALLQLVARRLLRTLDIYLRKHLEDEQLTVWAAGLAGTVDPVAKQRREIEYHHWARRMEELRYEFQRCAAKLNAGGTLPDISIKPYDLIDRARWESIRARAGIRPVSFFDLRIESEPDPLTYRFEFAEQFRDRGFALQRADATRVSLIASEQFGASEPIRLGHAFLETPLSFRSLFVCGKDMIYRRFDKNLGHEEERPAAPVEVAQGFLQEVVETRLR